MLLALVQIIGSNVDDVAADRLSGANGQSEVLVTLVDTEFGSRLRRLVDRLLVNRVLLREVYQLATIPCGEHMWFCVALCQIGSIHGLDWIGLD